MFTNTLHYERQNVFFTLFLGYLAFCAIEYFKDKRLIQLLCILGLLVVSIFLKADYGWRGYIFLLDVYKRQLHICAHFVRKVAKTCNCFFFDLADRFVFYIKTWNCDQHFHSNRFGNFQDEKMCIRDSQKTDREDPGSRSSSCFRCI